MEVAGKARVRFGEFEFDPVSLKLFREGRPLKIEPQPLRVLGTLLEKPGQIVSREDLRMRIWGQATFVEFDQSLNYCVRQIRVALREGAANPRFLETLPKQGYRFIGNIEVEAPAKEAEVEHSDPPPVAPPRHRWGRAGAAIAFLGLLAAAIAWFATRDRPAAKVTLLNLSILPPPATSFVYNRNGEGGFAISPNGAVLAFIGRTEGKSQLWVRRLDQADSRLVNGSEGAYRPFWSPDSRWIGFFTPLKLKKVEVANGTTVDLCDVPPNTSGGTWSTQGVILWGTAMGPPLVQRISDVGGVPVGVPAAAGIEPHFLPDGRRFVYRAGYWSSDLWLGSLDSREKPRRIGKAGSEPTYSAGHLLWVSNGNLMAQPFDAARGELTGAVMRVNAPLAVRVHLGLLLADFSANPSGMLVYPPRTNALAELRWRDRTGKLLQVMGPPGEYYTPRISPDGRRVAFTRREESNSDVWVANLATNTLTRLTFDPGIDDYPVWSPDGTALTFAHDEAGTANLYRKAATGTGPVERLTSSPNRQQPLDWSGDGRFLLFTEITSTSEIMVRSSNGGEPQRYLNRGLGAVKAQFNPGAPRWIAYDFDDSGRREVYVQAFEPGKMAPPARWQISTAGATMPRWRGDGKEIFFFTLDGQMMATRVSGEGSSFESSTPEALFRATPPLFRSPSFEYDVTPDGQRFILVEPAEKPEYRSLTLVSRWK